MKSWPNISLNDVCHVVYVYMQKYWKCSLNVGWQEWFPYIAKIYIKLKIKKRRLAPMRCIDGGYCLTKIIIIENTILMRSLRFAFEDLTLLSMSLTGVQICNALVNESFIWKPQPKKYQSHCRFCSGRSGFFFDNHKIVCHKV